MCAMFRAASLKNSTKQSGKSGRISSLKIGEGKANFVQLKRSSKLVLYCVDYTSDEKATQGSQLGKGRREVFSFSRTLLVGSVTSPLYKQHEVHGTEGCGRRLVGGGRLEREIGGIKGKRGPFWFIRGGGGLRPKRQRR